MKKESLFMYVTREYENESIGYFISRNFRKAIQFKFYPTTFEVLIAANKNLRLETR